MRAVSIMKFKLGFRTQRYILTSQAKCTMYSLHILWGTYQSRLQFRNTYKSTFRNSWQIVKEFRNDDSTITTLVSLNFPMHRNCLIPLQLHHRLHNLKFEPLLRTLPAMPAMTFSSDVHGEAASHPSQWACLKIHDWCRMPFHGIGRVPTEPKKCPEFLVMLSRACRNDNI